MYVWSRGSTVAIASSDIALARYAARRLVGEIGGQPAFHFLDCLPFSPGVACDLVLAQAPDREVMGLGMREIQAAHACRRRHRRVLGPVDAEGRRIQQVEQLELLTVVGTCGMAESRPA